MRKKTVVPKTLYRWEHNLKNGLTSGISSSKIRQVGRKSLLVLTLVSLWYWNWQLLLSATIGISLMWLIYKVPYRYYIRWWQNLIIWFGNRNQKLFRAVIGGSSAGLLTYMMSAIWIDTENHWLAVGWILQGILVSIALGLLVWQAKERSETHKEAKLSQFLEDLTADDPLKCAIAIHQLGNLARQKILDREQKSQIRDYFCFMLTQPQERLVRESLLDSLEIFDGVKISLPPTPVVRTPIELTKSIRELS